MDAVQQCSTGEGELVERHILIAVDASENSKRAVLFVGDFFGCYPAIRVTILNIIFKPADGFFKSDKEYDEWLAGQQSASEEKLADYRRMLVESGFPAEKVEVKIKVMQGASVASCIIQELEKMKCCTVVIGRRGISKKEEFIFGSTSNRILHDAKKCAVMVIE